MKNSKNSQKSVIFFTKYKKLKGLAILYWYCKYWYGPIVKCWTLYVQQSSIMSVLEVRNNFIKTRVTVKSSDLMSALFNGQISSKYNNIGMHLLYYDISTKQIAYSYT